MDERSELYRRRADDCDAAADRTATRRSARSISRWDGAGGKWRSSKRPLRITSISSASRVGRTRSMAIPNQIVALLAMQHRLLTAKEIAEMLFGKEKGYPQRVHGELRELFRQGRVERLGNGGVGDPYKYRIKPTPSTPSTPRATTPQA